MVLFYLTISTTYVSFVFSLQVICNSPFHSSISLPESTLPTLAIPMLSITQTCIPKIQAIRIAHRIPSKQRDATSVSSQFCKPTL